MAQPTGGGDGRRSQASAGQRRSSWRNVAQQVCVSYAVRAEAAEAVVAEIATAGGRAIAVAADIADSAAFRAMVTRAEAELGPVTILVNNAGVAWQGTLDTYDREQVARMRQVNVDGVIHATRAVMASIRARRYGRIVNLASMAAIGTALSGNAFYVATKAEVINSNAALCPGAGPARHHRERRGARLRPHRHDAARPTEERFAARAMMGRIGEPEASPMRWCSWLHRSEVGLRRRC